MFSAAAADGRRGASPITPTTVPGGRRSAPARFSSAQVASRSGLAGLAIRAWRAIRKRLRKNQAQVANTAATGTSNSARTAGVPDRQRDHELHRHRRDRREQDRVRAIAREMLARRSPRAPRTGRCTTPPISARSAVTDHADDQHDRADEDRDLGHRQAAERAGRPLAVGTQRARATAPGRGRAACRRTGRRRRRPTAAAPPARRRPVRRRLRDRGCDLGAPTPTRRGYERLRRRRAATTCAPSRVGSTRPRTRGTAR